MVAEKEVESPVNARNGLDKVFAYFTLFRGKLTVRKALNELGE